MSRMTLIVEVAITVGVTGELLATDPARVGPYRVVGRLGQGGMGHVYLARSPGGRAVAIKVVRPELAAKRGFRDRFAREVAAARGVSGVFTAAVVDADPDAELPWMATAYVDGPSLADAIEEHGALPPDAVLSLAAGLAEGLQAIHDAGLVHRDLKPSNVLLAKDGPRVIDFGISWAREESRHGDRLTDAGMVVGSPGFLSPEQAMGREVGPASDVFSLGAVLAYAATGDEPFGYGATQALMYRVVHEPPDLSLVPGSLRRLIGSCLAKEAGHRPTMAQLLDRLAAFPEPLYPTGEHDVAAGLLAAHLPAPGPLGVDPLMAALQGAGPPAVGLGAFGASLPGVPQTGDRLPVTDYPAAGVPGAAATRLDGFPGDSRQLRDGTARRWWLTLAAAVLSLGLLAGAAVLLTSHGKGQPPLPARPGTYIPPLTPGASNGSTAPVRPSASPGQRATSPASSAARPGASGGASTGPAKTTPPARPSPTTPPPATSVAPPSAPQPTTVRPTATRPASSPPTCLLICIS
jgi:hypothetical protein